MAWAVFKVESNWTRPNSMLSFNAKACPKPQERPQDFIEYCVSKGWAEKVDSPTRDQKRSIKGRNKG